MNEARRRALRTATRASAAWALCSLGGCAGVLGAQTLTLSEAELTQRLAERFPQERRLLDWIDLQLDTPQVLLRPDSNRVAVDLEMELREKLTGRRFPLQVGLDSALRYDAGTQAIVLSDVKLHRLGVTAVPQALAGLALQLGAPMVERLLEGQPVHRFSARQLTGAAGAGWRPDAIRVTPHGVEMKLVPVGRT
jgi:hypothetical protein